MNDLRRYRPLLLIMLLFTAVSLTQQMALPFMEGGDEWHHYNYIQHLRETGTLPPRNIAEDNPLRQASGQAPLHYALAALLLDVMQQPITDGADLAEYLQTNARNPWFAPPDAWNRTDNRNVFKLQSALQPHLSVMRVTRLLSMLWGIVAIGAAYGAMREVFRERRWQITGTALFAFMPMFVQLSSVTRNDAAAIAMATLALWQALRLLRVAVTGFHLFLLGMTLGVAGLIKINALMVAPAVAVALMLRWHSKSTGAGQILRQILWIAIPAALCFLPWVVYGFVMYGDPLGTQTHHIPGHLIDPPLTIGETIQRLPRVYISYLAQPGSAVWLHPVTYAMLGIVVLGSVAGMLRNVSVRWFGGGRPLSLQSRQQIIVLMTFAAVAFVAMIYWLRQVNHVTGHVLYPAHSAIILLMTAGLRSLTYRQPYLDYVTRLAGVGVVVFASGIAAYTSLQAAYMSPRILTNERLPVLSGAPVTYGNSIRFLGYQDTSTQLDGDIYTITLCWEILKETSRPAAFSIRLVRDGEELTQRTSLHGMGRYHSELWQEGAIFCDDVDIPLPSVIPPEHSYRLLLHVFNAETGAFDWQAVDTADNSVPYPFILDGLTVK